MPPAAETMRCVSTTRSMMVRPAEEDDEPAFAVRVTEDVPLPGIAPRTSSFEEPGALLGTTRTATLLAREVSAMRTGNIVPYTKESTRRLSVRANVARAFGMLDSVAVGFSETAAS